MIQYDDNQESTQPLTDADMKGPEGSRFSNYHLWSYLLESNLVFNDDLHVVDEEPRSVGFTEIQVFEDYDDSGVTHEWRLVRLPRPWEMNQPTPKLVTIYESGQVYGGPAEGGWWWNAAQVTAAVLIDNPWVKHSVDKAIYAADLLLAIDHEIHGEFEYPRSRRDWRFHWSPENVFGLEHSVGSRYYC